MMEEDTVVTESSSWWKRRDGHEDDETVSLPLSSSPCCLTSCTRRIQKNANWDTIMFLDSGMTAVMDNPKIRKEEKCNVNYGGPRGSYADDSLLTYFCIYCLLIFLHNVMTITLGKSL